METDPTYKRRHSSLIGNTGRAKHMIDEKIAHSRKRKTKTFTGCWTCRRRKVKCDTIRPYCQRCSKSGLDCEGYDIELCWVTGRENVPPSAIKRKAMRQEASPLLFSPLDKVDQMLIDLDQLNPLVNSEVLSMGPFSVFNSQTYSLEEALVESCAREPDSLPECLSSLQELGTLERSGVELPSPLLTRRLGSSIYRDPVAGMLMDNYVHNVANLLQPIFHPHNPYSSVYVPAAIRGSVDLLFGVGSIGAVPPSYVAISYSLLAASAFHLRGPVNCGSQLDKLGTKFRTNAFRYVREALQKSPATVSFPEHPYPDVTMAAILTLITTDVIEGRMAEYWIHLDGCDQLLRKRNYGESSRQLKTIYSFLVTLSNTTLYDLPNLPWSEDECHFNMLPTLSTIPNDSSLEFTYGITSTLATMMSLTTKLSQHILFYASRNQPLPQTLKTACEILGKHISEWSISSEPLSSIDSSDPVTLSVAKLHILAFGHALNVYYHTRVRPCEPHTMTFYVNAVAEDLQSIEAFRKSQDHRGPVSASVMWPGFIAACEATPSRRSVWQAWWADMLTYRIGNIPHLWQVVQDVWAARDAGDMETPGYIGVLRRQGKKVLAV